MELWYGKVLQFKPSLLHHVGDEFSTRFGRNRSGGERRAKLKSHYTIRKVLVASTEFRCSKSGGEGVKKSSGGGGVGGRILGRESSSKSSEQESRGHIRRIDRGVQLARHVEIISSGANAYVKHLVKLRQSASYRNACGSVVVVGSVPLREICEYALKKGGGGENLQFEVLLVLDWTPEPPDLAIWSDRILRVSEAVMCKVAGVESSQGLGCVGVLPLPSSFCNLEAIQSASSGAFNWCPSPRRVLVLDGIQDPGNLGTLLRTAAAFSWDGVFLLPGCCDPFNEKAVRASRGACFRVSIATGHWDLLQQFVDAHQMKLYAAEPEHQVTFPATSNNAINSVNASSGAAMYPTEIEMTAVASGPNCLATAGAEDALCLVLGSEGQGLSEVAQRACNRVSIPMPGLFESLNVAVAGGILLYLLKHDMPPPSSWSKLL
ncbi:hypothetical protein BDL97_11G041300 [Sphagnum fallax]|nr:hypothetical protein BDL97_11G041300 [Sphagnum fallax]